MYVLFVFICIYKFRMAFDAVVFMYISSVLSNMYGTFLFLFIYFFFQILFCLFIYLLVVICVPFLGGLCSVIAAFPRYVHFHFGNLGINI